MAAALSICLLFFYSVYVLQGGQQSLVKLVINRTKHIVDLDALREEVPAILRGSQMTVLEIWKQHLALDCHIIGS